MSSGSATSPPDGGLGWREGDSGQDGVKPLAQPALRPLVEECDLKRLLEHQCRPDVEPDRMNFSILCSITDRGEKDREIGQYQRQRDLRVGDRRKQVAQPKIGRPKHLDRGQ